MLNIWVKWRLLRFYSSLEFPRDYVVHADYRTVKRLPDAERTQRRVSIHLEQKPCIHVEVLGRLVSAGFVLYIGVHFSVLGVVRAFNTWVYFSGYVSYIGVRFQTGRLFQWDTFYIWGCILVQCVSFTWLYFDWMHLT